MKPLSPQTDCVISLSQSSQRAQRGLKILKKNVYLSILFIIYRNNIKINNNDKI